MNLQKNESFWIRLVSIKVLTLVQEICIYSLHSSFHFLKVKNSKMSNTDIFWDTLYKQQLLDL